MAQPPVEQIMNMRQQGLSNNQITQNLQRDGFKTHEIFEGMNQADMKAGVSQQSLQQMQPPQNPMQPPQGPPTQPSQGAQFPEAMPPPMGAPEGEPMGRLNPMDERIEEIAEAIIDEKWTDLLDNVRKIIDWKDKTTQRIDQIEQKFVDLKSEFDKLHSSILDRIGQYDQNMTDIGSEIKALEKVFQKILPTLTENVNELSRISADLRSK